MDQNSYMTYFSILYFSQKRFNKKEKVEEKLEKKLKDFEVQSKNLKHQVSQLEDQLSSVKDENQGSQQEVDVLKDCLMQMQVCVYW